MKKLVYLTILSFSVLVTACNGPQSRNQPSAKKIENNKDHIQVIYFHAEHRCRACLDIEDYTRYTLNTYFQEQLKDSTITFQTVNVDKEENYAIAEEYQSGGSALFLNVVHNGTSKKIDLTDFAFLNSSNKRKFTWDLKAEISNELKTLSL